VTVAPDDFRGTAGDFSAALRPRHALPATCCDLVCIFGTTWMQLSMDATFIELTQSPHLTPAV
jgi:hypothetical protein